MSFELTEFVKAKLTEVEVLSKKDREPDANPGVALHFTLTMGNDVLSLFHGSLRGDIFTKSAAAAQDQAQPGLETVEPVSDMPHLTWLGSNLGQFGLPNIEYTGFRLVVDHGMGGKSDLDIDDCTLSNFRIQGKVGGTTVIKLKLEAPDVSEKVHGKLAKLKSQEIPIKLLAPEVKQTEIEDDKEGSPFPNGHKEGKVRQTPEQALAAALGQTEEQGA